MATGSSPIATNANTYVSDLPDYVKPYYQMLLNASSALAFDPAFIQEQLPSSTYRPNSIAQGSTAGLGSLTGNQAAAQALSAPQDRSRGLMSLSSNISPLPGGVSTVGTGVGSPAPGGTNYNPVAGGTGNVGLPTPVPMLPNGQGQVGNGPGSPSTTPGYGTGRVGPISNPGPGATGGGSGTAAGSGNYTQNVQYGNPVIDASGSAAIARVIAEGRANPAVYGWSIADPSVVPQIKQMYTSLKAAGMTDNQIDANAELAGLVAQATGMGAINDPMLGPYSQNEYVFKPTAQSGGIARLAEGGILNLAEGGTTYPAYDTTMNTPPTYNFSQPQSASQSISHPQVLQSPGYYDNGSGYSYYDGPSPGGTGDGSYNPSTAQGSYPMAAYNPYPGQRVLDPSGMFGFDASSSDPYKLSSPTQFAENQAFYGYTYNDPTSPFGGRSFLQAPLQQAKNYISDTYDRSYDAVKNAENQYGSLLANPLQSQYQAMQFNVDPFTQYQVGAPMSVSPDLSAFSSRNTPQINQYPAVAYGVNPGAWVDQGISSAYMNPYTQQVTQAQQNLINRNFDEQLSKDHATAAQAGAFGGTRQAVQDSLSNRDRQMQLDTVAAQNLNNAYNSGMGQFNQDRGAVMQAGQYGLQADLANQNAAMGAQYANQNALLNGRNQAAGYDLQAQLANQNAGLNAGQFNANLANSTQNQQVQAMLQAAGMTNQSNLTADQQSMAAWLNNQNALNANQQTQQGLLGLMSNQSTNLGNMENLQQQLDMQRLQQISGVGATEDARRQNILDLGYQNFVNQQNWPYQLSNYYSGILRGVPTSVNQEQFQYQTYNPASQWAGLGLAGLGASGVNP